MASPYNCVSNLLIASPAVHCPTVLAFPIDTGFAQGWLGHNVCLPWPLRKRTDDWIMRLVQRSHSRAWNQATRNKKSQIGCESPCRTSDHFFFTVDHLPIIGAEFNSNKIPHFKVKISIYYLFEYLEIKANVYVL